MDTGKETFSFYGALRKVMQGKQITKLEWKNVDEYGFLSQDGMLKIHRPDGKDYNWALSDGDILGLDFIIK